VVQERETQARVMQEGTERQRGCGSLVIEAVASLTEFDR